MRAAPESTVMGLIETSLTMPWPVGDSRGRLRTASTSSNETSTSAWPGSHTIEETDDPKRTVVETDPPRCAMPWISETLTS